MIGVFGVILVADMPKAALAGVLPSRRQELHTFHEHEDRTATISISSLYFLPYTIVGM